jgi:sortase B
MSGENYAEYFDEIASRSLYSTGIDVNTDDKILTLSTCTRDMDISTRRGETNARCVLVARLIRDGESEEVDTSLATVNGNPRYPQIWYDKYKKANPYKNAERWYPKGVRA